MFGYEPETKAATSWICCSVSSSSNDGIAPPPSVTCLTTWSYEGDASSRFGPTLPDEPAAENVWQPPQPADAKTSLPAAASPLPVVDVVVDASVVSPSQARRQGRPGRARGA